MFLYNTAVLLYTFVIHISSLFKPKAKLWVEGRRDWRNKLKNDLKKTQGYDLIWIHCASLGEFEQGRPVIESIKKQFPSNKILLTFFSPSGYEIRKNYEFADVISYLPYDSKQNAIEFIKISNPKTVIFVKYEFWLNYLFILNKNKIPTYLISAVFKKHQPFFKWYGNVFRSALKTYTSIFVQDNQSLELLKSIGVQSGIECGDTRIDRVLQIKNETKTFAEIENFCLNNFVIVAGSSWPQDEALLIPAFSELKKTVKNLKLIIAPHETDQNHILALEKLLLENNLSYSLFTKKETPEYHDVLVIDTIGILSHLYRYGKLAYIGGGFSNGIHNVLEPAVYGLPVVFGPNNKKFNEARQLMQSGGGFEINDKKTLQALLDGLINNADILINASQKASEYVENAKGASEIIINRIFNSHN